MDPLDLIARTGAPAFITDECGLIAVWSRGAEELLGYPADQVLGKPCHELLCGQDVFGNRFCDRQCPLTSMVERQETIHRFELDVRTGAGQTVPTGFSIIAMPGARAGQYSLIHFLEPIDRRREASELIRRALTIEPAPPSSSSAGGEAALLPSMTAREIQVLRLLAEGRSTQVIAESLFISITTTRNHIQNILRKLNAHSKLEAVSLALRTHLL